LETLYDCESDGLFQFLKEVKDRSDEMGWTTSILKITTTDAQGTQKVEDFMGNYRTIILEDVDSSEQTYILGQNGQAQDSYMFYKCLMASLTNEAKKKIMI
jgi:hypothetical protein